jgi:hypothetical protein
MSQPAITLETEVIRDWTALQTAATIDVRQANADPSQVTLSVGGSWGTTTATLTPTEARALATALEHTAVRAAAVTEGSSDE